MICQEQREHTENSKKKNQFKKRKRGDNQVNNVNINTKNQIANVNVNGGGGGGGGNKTIPVSFQLPSTMYELRANAALPFARRLLAQPPVVPGCSSGAEAGRPASPVNALTGCLSLIP